MCIHLWEGPLLLLIGLFQGSNEIVHIKKLAQFPAHSSHSINVYSSP